jgi:cystathionine beta-lyase/cystathionine gamma-synthase
MLDLSYLLNHLGEEREKHEGAINPPLYQTSNFAAADYDELVERIKNEFDSPFYSRGYNPTAAIVRKKIAALEGTEDALLCSSGSAAISCAVLSQLKAGDHILCIEKPYSWTSRLLVQLLSRFNIEYTFTNGKNAEKFLSHVQPNTRLIYLESPNSITFEQQDIETIARFAKQHNIKTLIDNSYATPLGQNPAQWGVDLILHSATKYLNGHSDVVAGVICGRKELIRPIFANEWMTLGAQVSPHDCSLLLRGLRTLEIRVQRSAESALQVIHFLDNHPKVEKVYHPFSKHYDQSDLTKKQLKICGGLLSFTLLDANENQIKTFVNSLKNFLLATSWGGHESLVFPMSVLQTASNYLNPLVPKHLIRMYIGLEHPTTLIEDLKKSLDMI